MRRMRAALIGLEETVIPDHVEAVMRYIKHLDLSVERSTFDREDKLTARREDQQGLGLSRRKSK